MRITKSTVDKLVAPTEKDQKIFWDDEVKGFGIRVTRGGAKSYIVQKVVSGKTVRHTLGRHGVLTPTEARERAQKQLVQMLDGINPKAEKKRIAAQNQTLAELVKVYCENKQTRNGKLRPSTITNCHKVLNNMFADWKDKPVASITRQKCVERFQQASKTTPSSANLGFRVLKGWLSYYNNLNETDDGKVAVNPVARAIGMGRQAQFNPEGVKDTRVPLSSLGAVWSSLKKWSDPQTNVTGTATSANFVMFMILSGCRVGEAGQLKWADVNLDAALPTFFLSADVTKTHVDLTQPLSTEMKALLERQLARRTKNHEYVFESAKGKEHFSDPRRLLHKLEDAAGCYVHNHALRRTTESIMQACGIDGDLRRTVLNHAAQDIHAKHYGDHSVQSLLPAVQAVSDYLVAAAKEHEATCTVTE